MRQIYKNLLTKEKVKLYNISKLKGSENNVYYGNLKRYHTKANEPAYYEIIDLKNKKRWKNEKV